MLMKAAVQVLRIFIGAKDKIDGFLPFLDSIFKKANCGGLLTIEKTEVIQ